MALRYELTPIHVVSRIEFAGNLQRGARHRRRAAQARRRRSVRDVAAARPHQRAVARDRRHAARARVSAVRRSARGSTWIADRSGRRWSSASIPGRARRSATVAVVGAPMMSPEAVSRPARPGRRRAVRARGAQHAASPATSTTRRARGYYRRGSTPAVSFADDDRVANLTLTVDARPARQRRVHRRSAARRRRVTALVPIEREGSADEDLLEDSSNRIEEYLRAQGYRDARAPHTRQEKDGELLITFAVQRGPQYRVGAVEISGGSVAAGCRDLRSSLRTRVGEPISDANLDADVTAIESVYRGRGFAAVRVQADPRPQPATAEAADPGRGQHPHHRGRPHDGRHGPHRGQRVGSGSDASPGSQPAARRAVLRRTAQARHRRDSAGSTPIAATGRRPCRRSLASRRIARRRISCSPSAKARGSSSITF